MEDVLKKIAPYNLWSDSVLPIGDQRKEYTEKLIKYTGNRLVKILTGQRRAGKSYIMRQLAMHLIDKGVNSSNIIFINRELSAFDFLQTSRDLDKLIDVYRKEIATSGKIYIFIDEVQDIIDWEKTVNSLSQDYTFEAEIFLSGSNSHLLKSVAPTLLPGRYVEVSEDLF